MAVVVAILVIFDVVGFVDVKAILVDVYAVVVFVIVGVVIIIVVFVVAIDVFIVVVVYIAKLPRVGYAW